MNDFPLSFRPWSLGLVLPIILLKRLSVSNCRCSAKLRRPVCCNNNQENEASARIFMFI